MSGLDETVAALRSLRALAQGDAMAQFTDLAEAEEASKGVALFLMSEMHPDPKVRSACLALFCESMTNLTEIAMHSMPKDSD